MRCAPMVTTSGLSAPKLFRRFEPSLSADEAEFNLCMSGRVGVWR